MKKSVLVIDDDFDIRASVQDLLEIDGYQTHLAENGLEGLKVLRNLPAGELPGLILLDLMMPVMDGKKFLETLSQDEYKQFAKIPIIIASAKGHISENFENFPDIEVVKKPFDIGHFLSLVSKHCD